MKREVQVSYLDGVSDVVELFRDMELIVYVWVKKGMKGLGKEWQFC